MIFNKPYGARAMHDILSPLQHTDIIRYLEI